MATSQRRACEPAILGITRLSLLVLVFLSVAVLPVLSISFNVAPDASKCLREEIHKNVLVVGEYKLSDVAGQRTDIMVYSPFPSKFLSTSLCWMNSK